MVRFTHPTKGKQSKGNRSNGRLREVRGPGRDPAFQRGPGNDPAYGLPFAPCPFRPCSPPARRFTELTAPEHLQKTTVEATETPIEGRGTGSGAPHECLPSLSR